MLKRKEKSDFIVGARSLPRSPIFLPNKIDSFALFCLPSRVLAGTNMLALCTIQRTSASSLLTGPLMRIDYDSLIMLSGLKSSDLSWLIQLSLFSKFSRYKTSQTFTTSHWSTIDSIVVVALRPLVNETSKLSSTTPPHILYSENTPTAELSLNAKNMKQIQNIRKFQTMTATMKKQPDKLIIMISYIK